MSEVKHTPGPWALDGTGWICDANGSPICLINAGLDDHELEPHERADASLIAAAPEMLEALKAAKELADVMEGLSSGRSDDEWIWAAQEKINFAIAKAEGKV